MSTQENDGPSVEVEESDAPIAEEFSSRYRLETSCYTQSLKPENNQIGGNTVETARKIVALGGGEIGEMQTLNIDKRIVELTGKSRPKALFIPTASGDAPGYVDNFEACYGKTLGCQTHTLCLTQTPPAFEEISKQKHLANCPVYT